MPQTMIFEARSTAWRWAREEVAALLAQLDETRMAGPVSQRDLASMLDVPRPTLWDWVGRRESLEGP
jgi:hypothetical protein